ncbi:hypothetical protein EV421DRAFT_1734785 [Armillaria borealis]|uniref:Uncharacterized protein n=1 Tax=Armillaria borealis TaxID=47425 RepID=A0AA39JLQ3_9AGAR|nr:hypothetical protein EV421DRAFT_1734785 [Armillaria borealis]
MDKIATALPDVEVIHTVDPNVEDVGYVTGKHILVECNETEQDKGRRKIVEILNDDEHSDQIKSLKDRYDAILWLQKNKSDTDHDALKDEIQTLAIQQITDTIQSEPLEQLQERLCDAEAEANSYRLAADGHIHALQTSIAFMEGRAAEINSELERTWQQLNKHFKQDFIVTDIPALHQYLDHQFQMMHVWELRTLHPIQNAGLLFPSSAFGGPSPDARSMDIQTMMLAKSMSPDEIACLKSRCLPHVWPALVFTNICVTPARGLDHVSIGKVKIADWDLFPKKMEPAGMLIISTILPEENDVQHNPRKREASLGNKMITEQQKKRRLLEIALSLPSHPLRNQDVWID